MKFAVTALAFMAAALVHPAFADGNMKGTAPKNLKGSSVWTNTRGSEMYISVSSSGHISGNYINHDGNYSCQNTPYPISGWVDGTSIAFSVRWDNQFENCNSVTGWTGFYDSSTGKIETKWNLAISGTTDPSQIISGVDTFSVATKAETASLSK
jgi:hypothetical protein